MTRAFGLQVQIPPGLVPSTAQSQAQGKDPLGALPATLGLSSGSQLLPHASRQLRAEGSGTAGVGRGPEGGGKEARAGEGPGLRGTEPIVPPLCFLAHSGPSTQ